MIEFPCPQCGKRVRASDGHAGRRARCPSCSAIVTVPGTLEALSTGEIDRLVRDGLPVEDSVESVEFEPVGPPPFPIDERVGFALPPVPMRAVAESSSQTSDDRLAAHRRKLSGAAIDSRVVVVFAGMCAVVVLGFVLLTLEDEGMTFRSIVAAVWLSFAFLFLLAMLLCRVIFRQAIVIADAAESLAEIAVMLRSSHSRSISGGNDATGTAQP